MRTMTNSPPIAKRLPALAIRIRLGEKGLLGPGKVKLMELIDELGSISSAGRSMGMSYRRAWMLADELNGLFREPVINKQTGGAHGGGATLTALGREVIACFRGIEKSATQASADNLDKLQSACDAGARKG
jgi:molybdate transport system regulatory protein